VRREEARDRLPAGEPGRHRRHLQRDVLAQKLRQRRGVGVLEGRGEPVEQRPPARLSRLGDLILGRQRPCKLGPGPPQHAVHRGGRGAQQVRDLRGRPVQHVPQDQHRPLPRGQVLQRRDQGQPDARPRGGHRGRVIVLGGQQRVGQRLQPRHLRRRGQRGRGIPGRPAQPGRQGTAAAALDRGQARVGRDPVQPGAHRRAALEPVERAPRPQIRLLNQILGLLGRAQHPVAVSQQLAPEPPGEAGEILANRHH
jgi:hypothetical protein